MLDDLFGEADRRLVGRADIGRGESNASHLRACCVGPLSAPVPDIDIPQPRQPVDVFTALGVTQYRALPFGDEKRLPVVIGMVQGMHQIAPFGLEKQLGGSIRINFLSPSPLADNLTVSALPKQRRSWLTSGATNGNLDKCSPGASMTGLHASAQVEIREDLAEAHARTWERIAR